MTYPDPDAAWRHVDPTPNPYGDGTATPPPPNLPPPVDPFVTPASGTPYSADPYAGAPYGGSPYTGAPYAAPTGGAATAYPPGPYAPPPAYPYGAVPQQLVPGMLVAAPYGVDPVTGEPYSDKSRVAAGLLGLFLGGLGIGRFYAGHTAIGVAQLLVSVFTFGIGGLWGVIDGIVMLAGRPRDGQGRLLRP